VCLFASKSWLLKDYELDTGNLFAYIELLPSVFGRLHLIIVSIDVQLIICFKVRKRISWLPYSARLREIAFLPKCCFVFSYIPVLHNEYHPLLLPQYINLPKHSISDPCTPSETRINTANSIHLSSITSGRCVALQLSITICLQRLTVTVEGVTNYSRRLLLCLTFLDPR
jgi:hypothetical protein